MSLKQINAILWRSYLTSTSDALFGIKKSQYYIEMPVGGGDYLQFINGAGKTFVDDNGNNCVTFPVVEVEGGICEQREMTFKVLREDAARAGNMNIEDQSPANAYPLWSAGRGPLAVYEKAINDAAPQYAVIFRDVDNCFHARWIRHEDFQSLPENVTKLLQTKPAGWESL